MKINFVIIVLICFITEIANAQISAADSAQFVQFPETSDTIVVQDSMFIMTKSPWGAVARSAIIPGWGQFYNQSYWKIPIVWGVIGWFAYNWVQNNNDYSNYRSVYLADPTNSNRRLREFYRDNRDLFAIYIGLTYVANLIDAYVDAHLFDFDVSEDPLQNSRYYNMKVYFGRF